MTPANPPEVRRRRRPTAWNATAVVAGALAVLTASCEREERSFRVSTPSADATKSVRVTDLVPGPAGPPPTTPNGYEENAYALAQGQTLYNAYNCNGCHAQGGGHIGPPLIDDQWRYGSRPEQVYATLVQGRPNGMPAFGGKVPDQQLWALVAYVRSMSGLVPLDAAPGRLDHMQGAPPPHSIPTTRPVNSRSQIIPTPG
ncbi:MAG TPA: cytochrome c [Tepidisphaeraceae bacterium]|nr:cytochrome c [Tepidisphaeraceae bacterium]